MAGSFKEKRRYPRRAYVVPVIITRKDRFMGGQILNVSEEGLALEVLEMKDPLFLKEIVQIEFLPPFCQQLVSVRGVVRYVSRVTQKSRKTGKEQFFWVGVQMDNPPLFVRDAVKRYVGE